MKIIIKTKVRQDYQSVFAGFNKDLFLKLAPPFPPVKLLQFDGCEVNDIVKLELNFIFFKQTWESLIIANKATDEEIYFIDEGKKLPFFLKYWQHKHRIIKNGEQTEIIDDILYRTPFWLMDYLMFPLMYFQFYYRKPIYKKIFNTNDN